MKKKLLVFMVITTLMIMAGCSSTPAEDQTADDQQADSKAGGAFDMAPGDPIESSGSENGLGYLIEPASRSGDQEGAVPGFYLFEASEDEYPYKVIIDEYDYDINAETGDVMSFDSESVYDD